MPSYCLFIRDHKDQHLDGFTAFVLKPDGQPWMIEDAPIPATGLPFSAPNTSGQTIP